MPEASELGTILEAEKAPLVPVFIYEKGGLTPVEHDRRKIGQDKPVQEPLKLPNNLTDKHPNYLIQRKYKNGISYYLPIDPKKQPVLHRLAKQLLKKQIISGGPEDAIFVTHLSEEKAGELVKAGYSIFYPKEINDLLDRYETERPLKQNGRD